MKTKANIVKEFENRILKALEKYRFGAYDRYLAEDIKAESYPDYLWFCKALESLVTKGVVICKGKDGFLLSKYRRK